MLTTKRSLFLFLTGSFSSLALVNCSDSDIVIGGGGSGGAKAGSSATGGASGKAGAANPGGNSGNSGDAGSDVGGTGPGDAGASGSGDAGDQGTSGASGSSGQGGAGGLLGVSGSGGKGGSAGKGGSSGSGGSGGSAGSAGAGGAAGPHQAPILKYTFNETTGTVVADASVSGLNATVSLGSLWTVSGRNGGGLALAGGLLPTTYVTVPPGIFKNVKSTTIAAWVKLAANTHWSRIFDFGGTGTGTDARFMYLTPDSDGAGIRFSTYGGSGTRESTITTGTLLPLNVWKHVAVTSEDGGKRAIYIDGYPAAKSTTVDVPPSELEPLSASSWLGKSRFDTDGGLYGVLDDFTVYDRVLASTEIATLADPKGDYTRLAFDEGSGTTSADASTRAVNATLTGAGWASGQLGAAVQLSGAADAAQYVTLSSNPLAGCTTEATIALWVKQTSASNWARIFDFGGTSDNFMFLTPSNVDGKLQLNIHPTPPLLETMVVSSTAYPTDGGWHHVAVVLSTLVASIYVDGNVVGNAASPATPLILGATNEHWLGKSRFPDPYFKGSFDELRVACRAFTSDEIKSLAFH